MAQFLLNTKGKKMIEVEYNLLLVLVSYAIAVFGSYVGLNLAIRVPSAKPGSDLYFWVALSSIAIGGAIWSMHYLDVAGCWLCGCRNYHCRTRRL